MGIADLEKEWSSLQDRPLQWNELSISEIVAFAQEVERKRAKARALEIVGWHKQSYNGAHINPILADLHKAM